MTSKNLGSFSAALGHDHGGWIQRVQRWPPVPRLALDLIALVLVTVIFAAVDAGIFVWYTTRWLIGREYPRSYTAPLQFVTGTKQAIRDSTVQMKKREREFLPYW